MMATNYLGNLRVKLKYFIGLCFLLFLSHCQTTKDLLPVNIDASSSEDLALLQKIRVTEDLFIKNDFKNFLIETEKFKKENPQSLYIQYIRLLEARALLKQGKVSESFDINMDVQNQTFNASKPIYYRALFNSAEIFEAKNDFEKLLAALTECEKNKQYLESRQKWIELPIKLAVAYERLNLGKLSFENVTKAQQGLNQYLKENSLEVSALNQLYYEIGIAPLNWQSHDFQLELNKFSISYKYLVYSMNRDLEPFSKLAKNKMDEQIKWIWQLANTLPMDSFTDRIEQDKIQFYRMTEFSKLLNNIKTLEPLEGQKVLPLQREFYAQVDKILEDALEIIYAKYRYTPPTGESFRHQIFRSRSLVDEQLTK